MTSILPADGQGTFIAFITAVATLIGGGLGGALAVIAATFSQDRAQGRRERMLALAILADVETIRARLPGLDDQPLDPDALPSRTGVGKWVEPAVIELAGIDRRVYALVADLEPTIRIRNAIVNDYRESAAGLAEARRGMKELEQAIESPDEMVYHFGFKTQQEAWDRLRLWHEEVKKRESHTAARLARARRAEEMGRGLLEDIARRLNVVAARPIPRFPWPSSTELSPQRWDVGKLDLPSGQQ